MMFRKIFIFAVVVAVCWTAGAHALNWWEQSTICRLNTANCYTPMGAGFDPLMWDSDASCWGQKLICTDALVSSGYGNPVPYTKKAIKNGTGIHSDYDPGVLLIVDGCFGARRTNSAGNQAMVNGSYVNVWCDGVLAYADERVANGEIVTSGAQPTCQDLADQGWVAVLATGKKCYGKYYDPRQYVIECSGGDMLPERVISLNGAPDIEFGRAASVSYPTTQSAANAIFDSMKSNAAVQRGKHFK